MKKYFEPLFNGILKENPTFVLMLGMCPTLAVTTSASNGVGMGLTTAVDWKMNAQWLDVLARSGTPLFVSAAPEALGPEQEQALCEAFAIASVPHKPAEPVDWMETMCPAVWAFDSGEVTYDWYEDFGAEPLMY